MTSFPPNRVRCLEGALLLLLSLALGACTPFSGRPEPGPDKQGSGLLAGAAMGAGIGAEITALSGPGIWAGAGIGALFGIFSGMSEDIAEEAQLQNAEELRNIRMLAWADQILREQYERQLELHPGREIFPADLFFEQDSVQIKPEACALVHELAVLSRRRMPWSRVVIAAYITSSDAQSTYAEYVTRRRAEELALRFIGAGIEPRRVAAQAITLPEPILIDPQDNPSRYRQAIEIIRLDR